MNSSPRSRQPPHLRAKPSAKRRSQRSRAGLIFFSGLIYVLVGFIVTALPDQLWLWPLVLVGSWVQVWELTPPTQEQKTGKIGGSFLWLPFLRLLGIGSFTLALAVALNYLGTDQLDDITLASLIGQILALSLLAVLLALACRRTTATLAKRLEQRLKLPPRRVTLGTIALLGLAIGGLAGAVTP
ncbi:MAG TPA: hypothetical protein IGR64_13315 [Leptolyngbyaceae cyanobacterium M65_K2018_010]|nr:hypothetical protein [Leptolyngbyaceae cyanobacterium M65_K2018_010]